MYCVCLYVCIMSVCTCVLYMFVRVYCVCLYVCIVSVCTCVLCLSVHIYCLLSVVDLEVFWGFDYSPFEIQKTFRNFSGIRMYIASVS